MKKLLFTCAFFSFVLCVSVPGQETHWWDGGVIGPLHYRFPVEISNGTDVKEDFPVTIWIDFTEKLIDIGEIGALDMGSIRVLKVTSDTTTYDETISNQFEPAPDFGAISRAKGWLSWIISGRLEPDQTVYYHVYFDLQSYGIRPEEVALPWEAVCYNPANIILGASMEPEAAVTDLSRSVWRGWGEGGSPVNALSVEDGHWGRWSMSLVPGMNLTWEAQIGLLEPGERYLLGGYVKHGDNVGPGSVLRATFVSGGSRNATFSKDFTLDRETGWWREEIPLPAAPDTSLFSITLEFIGSPPDTLWVDDLFIYKNPPSITLLPCERMPE